MEILFQDFQDNNTWFQLNQDQLFSKRFNFLIFFWIDLFIFSKVFAPNILHCVKPGQRSEVSAERAEERIDVINVVRALLEHATTLFTVPAALLDEVYLHMMDTHPADLDLALSRRVEEWVSEWRFSIFNLLSQRDRTLSLSNFERNLWWPGSILSFGFQILFNLLSKFHESVKLVHHGSLIAC